MRINTNLGALTAASNLTKVNASVQSSAEKLSSGFRINKAADDAAGLGIANLFRSDTRALVQAQRNAEQANSVFQIAEGGASGIQKILERMKELAVQAASDSVDAAGRSRIDSEFQGLIAEIDRVTNTTEFQGSKLLAGGYGSTVTTGIATTMGTVSSTGAAGTVALTVIGSGAVVSATNGSGITQTLAFTAGVANQYNFTALGVTLNTTSNVTTGAINAASITTTAGSGQFLIGAARNASANYASSQSNVLAISGSALNLTTSQLTVGSTAVTTLTGAQTALSAVDSALALVNTALGVIGAGQNRIANAVDNLKSTILNYQAAESAIRDLDMADEMVKYSKNQIIAQAGTAMLAQANQAGQGILKLLQ
jgi:flagellin